MSVLIILGLIMAVPFVLAVLFRVSAVYLFVGVTAGNLFVQQFSDDASLVVSSVARNVDATLIAKLALQFLPVLLMLLFARRTASKNTAILQVVPLLFVSAMLAILSLTLLPASVSTAFYESSIGTQVREAEGLIIGATAMSQLLLIWSTKPKEHRKGRRSKHSL